MARIFYGGGISSIKGSIGGWTFQENLSGSIVRNRPIQRQNSTPKQTLIHNNLTGAINGWQNLTLLQQLTWNNYAEVHEKVNQWGQSIILTGFNWYYLINFNRVQMGLIFTAAPPAYILPDALPIYTLDIDGNSITIEYQSGSAPADTGIFIFTSSLLKSTATPFRSSLRFTKYQNFALASDLDITNDWEIAHSLAYPPVTTPYKFKIQALLVPVHNDTAIDGAGTKISDGIAQGVGGIGSMKIEYSFIVT